MTILIPLFKLCFGLGLQIASIFALAFFLRSIFFSKDSRSISNLQLLKASAGITACLFIFQLISTEISPSWSYADFRENFKNLVSNTGSNDLAPVPAMETRNSELVQPGPPVAPPPVAPPPMGDPSIAAGLRAAPPEVLRQNSARPPDSGPKNRPPAPPEVLRQNSR